MVKTGQLLYAENCYWQKLCKQYTPVLLLVHCSNGSTVCIVLGSTPLKRLSPNNACQLAGCVSALIMEIVIFLDLDARVPEPLQCGKGNVLFFGHS